MAAINKNFVIKNGIEVGENLIYGDKTNLKVGIGTTVPNYTLDVRGGIGATSISVGQTITANSGIFTSFNVSGVGTITTLNATGVTATAIRSTWSQVGLGLTFTTGIGTFISITGVGTIANLSSGIATVTKIHVGIATTYSETLVVSGNARVTGILTIGTGSITLNGNTDIITVGTGATIFSSGDLRLAGIITAYKFVGDGSALTGTISGVGINSDGVTIGTGVTFINFTGPGVSTVTVSAGIATVNFEGGGGSGTTIDKQTFNVGVGGTNLLTLTNSYTVGNIDVYINGIKLSPGDFSELTGNTVGITTAAVLNDVIDVVSFRGISNNLNAIGIQSGGVSIGNTFTTLNFIGAGNTFKDRGNGIIDISIKPPNDTFITNLSASGIATVTKIHVGIATTYSETLVVSGNARVTGILTIGTASITFDGITNRINVGTGLTLDGNTGIISASQVFAGGVNLASVASGSITPTSLTIAGEGATAVTINSSGINVTGVVTATSFVGSGANLTGISSVSFATTSFGLSGTPAILVSSVGINTTTVSGTKLYLNGNAASNIVGLGSTTATTTLDFSQGNNFSLTLGATITIANPTGVTTGQSGVIFIQENGTGAYTVGWGTSWDFASATAPTLITTANALNALPYFARSTTSIVVGSVISGIGTL